MGNLEQIPHVFLITGTKYSEGHGAKYEKIPYCYDSYQNVKTFRNLNSR